MAIKFLRISFSALPFVYFPALVMFPCHPPFSGSWLPACNDDMKMVSGQSKISLLIVIGLGTVDTLVFWNILQDVLFHAVYMVVASMSCFLEYLHIVRNEIHEISIRTSKGTRCKENNDNLCIYNGIVLLNKLIISRCGKILFPATFCGPWVLQILYLFATIRSIEGLHKNPFLFPLFCSGSINVVIISFLLSSFGSKIYTTSVSMKDEWTQKARKRNDKLARRRAKSLLPVYIKLGGNFIDRTTPILIEDFCVNQTVSLLLLGK
jgi:hypothetical protein